MLPNHCPLFTELCWVPDMPAAGLTSPHAAILMMLQGNACFAESHAVAQPVLTACGTFLRLSDPIPVPHRLTFPAFLYVFLTKTRLKPPSPCEGVSNVPWETDATAAAGLSIAMAWRRRKPTAVSLLLTTLWKIKSEASNLDWSESQAEIVSSRWAALGRMGAIGGWTTIWQHFHRQSWTTSSCFHLFLHVDTCTYKQWGHWVGSDPKPGLWALSEDQWLIQSHVLLSAVCYLQLLLLTPKQAGVRNGWSQQRLHHLSAPHLLCTESRGAEEMKISPQTFTQVLKAPWEAFRCFLPGLTHSNEAIPLHSMQMHRLVES